jgi:ABC-type Fe3+/spermidine/putrescine transport system ATPase subunit
MRFELKSLQSRLGLTTVFVTHDQSEAMALSDQVVVMNHGRIEQQDTPQAIYEHPKTRFVMNFIGRVNQLTGRVIENNGQAMVAIEGSRTDDLLPVPHNSNRVLPEGAQVALSFRMEAVRLAAPPAAGQLSGIITSSNYLGSHAEHLVKVGTSTVRVSSRPDPTVTIGDEVSLELDCSALRVFVLSGDWNGPENGPDE